MATRTKKITNKTETITVSVFDQILSMEDADFGLIISEVNREEAMMECCGDLMGDSIAILNLLMESTDYEWDSWRNRADIVKKRNEYFQTNW